MGLKDWLASGWLIEHEPSAEEIAALFAVAAHGFGERLILADGDAGVDAATLGIVYHDADAPRRAWLV